MYVHKSIAEYKKGNDLNEANMPKQESLLKLKVQQKSTSPVCDRVRTTIQNGLEPKWLEPKWLEEKKRRTEKEKLRSKEEKKKEKRNEQKKRKEEKRR